MQQPESTQMLDGALAALFGAPPSQLRDAEAIRSALQAGQGPLVAQLPWRPGASASAFAFDLHEITLTAWEGGRVRFVNPIPQEGAAGEEVGGGEAGPLRRLEAGGEESLDEASFRALLALGGVAFLAGA